MKIFTVTVGIPAYNEERNIVRLLKTVFGQKRETFDMLFCFAQRVYETVLIFSRNNQ